MFIHNHAVNGQDYSNNYFVNIFNKSGYTKDTHIVKKIMNVKRIYHNTSQTLQSELCIQIAGSNNNYIIIQSYSTYIDVMLELEFMLSFSTICFVKIALCYSADVLPKESNCHLLDVLECVKYIVNP